MEDVKEIVSLMDAYRTAPDVIYPIPEYGVAGDINYGEMTLSLHKQGGMALGDAGEGSWIVEVHHKGELIYSDASLTFGTPHTHLQAAVVAADFFANGESAREPFGERMQEWAEGFVSEDVRDSVS